MWVPRTRVFFGGCFLKSPDAADLGDVADADLAAWPASLDAVAGMVGRFAQRGPFERPPPDGFPVVLG